MNLLEQFVNFLKNHKNKPSFLTIKNYKADIRQFINWFENEFKIAFDPLKISLQTLDQYKASRNLSPSSIQRHISSLRKFFSFLNIEGIIDQNLLEKRTVSAGTLAEADPLMIRNFKSFLYDDKKSDLTIKNYINDIRSFFKWLEEVSLIKHAWQVTEKNLLNKINLSVIEAYKQRLIESKFSPLTINRKLSSLRNYINWAKSQGFLSSSHPEFISGSSPSGDSSQSNEMLKQAKYPEGIQHDTQETTYSSFPPTRLMQKSLSGANSLFDILFILPIAQTLLGAQYLFWKASGKKIFKENIIPSKTKDNIENIKKGFYAPLSISLQYFPKHKRAWHHIRHTRPNWYKKYHSYSFTHYLHFAILIIVSSIIGFAIHNGYFADIQKGNSSFAQAPTASPRLLSFQGKLSDSTDNPIIKSTNVLFSIYKDAASPSETFLWKETESVQPNPDGTFSMLLGKNNPIPDTLFTQNPKLFLGIQIEDTPELSPRQQLATIPFAGNAETLQGMETITNAVKTSNAILALDSGGNLNILDSKSHTFQAIGGNFVLSGKVLSLTTIPGSNTNVEIVPDGTGQVDIQKPIQNSSNNNNLSGVPGAVEFADVVAILATTSAQSAFNINQNSTGMLISASTSGTAKFTVDNDGTGTFASDVNINGGDLTSSSTVFNFLDSNVTTLNFARSATNLILGASTGTITFKNAAAVLEGNVTLGKNNANTITFNGRIAEDSSLIPSTTNGTNNLGSSSLPWDNSYINNIYTLKLDVQDSQEATATAQIFNTSTGTDADGLVIKLGNTSSTVSATNHFASFETSGIGIVGSIQGNEGTGVTYATSGIADFAEYFKKDKNLTIQFGSVVCLNNSSLVVPCDNNNGKILGIASQRPAFLGGENLGDRSIAVGLVGQVDTLVSISNGTIKAGDALSASDIPGVAVKATYAGQIVGKALENLDSIDESEVVGYYDPDNKEYRRKDSFPNISLKPNIVKVVKINTSVNVSWHDPDTYLTSTGDLSINPASQGQALEAKYVVKNPLGEIINRVGSFAKIAVTDIKSGLVNASEIVTQSLIVTSDSLIINGQNLKEYIAQVVQESPLRQDSGGQAGIISPIIMSDQISTNIISPLGQSLVVKLATPSAEIHDSSFIIQNSSGSAVVKIDDSGNASFSGQLSASSGQFEGASVSGTLRADKIIADNIEGLEKQDFSFLTSHLSSDSAQLSYVPDFSANTGQFNQGLMVFGSTSLSDASITGQLSINGTMFVTENSIETLGTDLSLQSLRQGGLSIMGGLIYIDTNGNIKVQGDASITGKLAITGDVIASGSATFSKLNFSLVQPALAVSDTELIASSSAGIANISPFQAEVTIKNPLVTENSIIYITPVGTPSAQTPFLMRQTYLEPDITESEASFTVGVESPTKNPIPFNWLIVN